MMTKTKEPIRVLHVVGKMDIGGIENMLYNFSLHTNKEIVVFDYAVHGNELGHYAELLKKHGSRFFQFPVFRGINILEYVLAWYKFYKKHTEYVIIHGHMLSTGIIYLSLARLMKRVTIAHCHSTSYRGNFLTKNIKKILEYPLRYISHNMIACSYKAGIVRFGGIFKEKGILWNNAIDYGRFKFNKEKREKIRGKYNIFPQAVVIGHVGRLTWPKNHEFLLKIFSNIVRETPKYVLMLVGDGEQREYINSLIQEYGIENSVLCIGEVDNVEDYLCAMDIFAFPSRYEGLPTACIEAQISGLKCIISANVTKEVDISKEKSQVEFLPLSSIDNWKNTIQRYSTKRFCGLCEETYNLFSVINWAEQMYVSFYKSTK